MTRELLRRSGEALYGPRWQAELAQALGVADRTVRRWLSGDRGIPPSLASEILALANQHERELVAVRLLLLAA